MSLDKESILFVLAVLIYEYAFVDALTSRRPIARANPASLTSSKKVFTYIRSIRYRV